MFAACGEVDHIQVLRAHECDVIAARRKTRVRLCLGGLGQSPNGRIARVCAEVVEEQITGERDQQIARVRRKLIVDDARERGGARSFAPRLFLG